MDYLRKNFGVCIAKNTIYIVGGFNFKEGNLRKCEKIIFD